MSWQLNTPTSGAAAATVLQTLSVSSLNAAALTVNLGDGITPDLPAGVVVTQVVVTPAVGVIDTSEWDLIRSDGSSDDVLASDSQDTAKRILKLRGNTSNAALANVNIKVFYAPL